MTDATTVPRIRPIAIAKPVLGDEEWEALRGPLSSGWLTQGPEVAAFELEFAKAHHVRHALATTSCTTALHLALATLGIGPGDEVVVPAFTWVATANAVLYCGATPRFVDVDPQTFNLDPLRLREVVNSRTKAIIAVHLFGLCADVDRIAEIAPGVPIVEDAACAVGAEYHGRFAGTLGSFGCFSFHPRKIITTGEGGMLTTGDDALAERASCLRNHGASISEEQRHRGPRPYLLPEFQALGYNYRMTDLQGAVGRVQMRRLPELLAERRRAAAWYESELAGIDWLKSPSVPEGYEHSWQAYVCLVDAERAPCPRNDIMERLAEQGISTRPGTHAVHMLDFYRNRFGFEPDDFPGARDCDRCSLAIPLHHHLGEDDYVRIVDALKSVER